MSLVPGGKNSRFDPTLGFCLVIWGRLYLRGTPLKVAGLFLATGIRSLHDQRLLIRLRRAADSLILRTVAR